MLTLDDINKMNRVGRTVSLIRKVKAALGFGRSISFAVLDEVAQERRAVRLELAVLREQKELLEKLKRQRAGELVSYTIVANQRPARVFISHSDYRRSGLSVVNYASQWRDDAVEYDLLLDCAAEQLQSLIDVNSTQLETLTSLQIDLLQELCAYVAFICLIVSQRAWYLHHSSHPPEVVRTRSTGGHYWRACPLS